jgi:hypothetical protein
VEKREETFFGDMDMGYDDVWGVVLRGELI